MSESSPVRPGAARTGLSIQSILLIMLLAVSVVSNVVVGVIGYANGTESLRAAAIDRLTAVRESRAREVRALFEETESALRLAAEDEAVADAVLAFGEGFDELEATARPTADDEAAVTALVAAGVEGTEADDEALRPRGAAAVTLLAHYGTGDHPEALDDAGDGSAWSAAHARHHDYFRTMVELFGFGDAVLVDADGRIVYTVRKSIDLGAELARGSFDASGLGEVVRTARGSGVVDGVALADYSPYPGAFGDPVGWAAVPIERDDGYLGTLAVRLPGGRVDTIMAGGDWQESGLGRTGEAYLVGGDHLMRSGSRVLAQAPDDYAARAIAAGTARGTADAIVAGDSTLLRQSVTTAAVDAALAGETGTTDSAGYLGGSTIAAYAPLGLAGLGWVVVAQMDADEAFQPVSDFAVKLALSSAILVILVSIASVLIAQLVVRPLRRLRDAARRIASGEEGVVVDAGTSDELADVATAFNDMSRSLELRTGLLAEERRENERLLGLLMPSSIAERYRKGDATIVEEHRDVTVLFADIVGFEDWSRTVSQEQALDLLNDIVRAFDDAAERLGVERVRTTRQGYFASCGLAVPRVDHARRMVDFALELRRVVARFGSRAGARLELRAGVDCGTVSSGLVGRARVMYDLWGDAVNLAFRLQSEFHESGVFVTQRVIDRLPETPGIVESGEIAADGGMLRVWRVDTESADAGAVS